MSHPELIALFIRPKRELPTTLLLKFGMGKSILQIVIYGH